MRPVYWLGGWQFACLDYYRPPDGVDDRCVRAEPFPAVLAKLKEVGEIAVPGGFAGSGDLIRMANLEDLRGQVDITESELAKVRMNQRAEVTPDAYPDHKYPAHVVKSLPAKHVALLQLVLPDGVDPVSLGQSPRQFRDLLCACDESVSLARDGQYVISLIRALTECSSKRRHLAREIVLLDGCVWPHPIQ